MRHTQFNDSHTRVIPGRATGYSRNGNGAFGIDMSDWEQTGDGAVLTNVEDLFRWDQNFYDPKVGDPKLLEAMQAVGVLNSGKKLEYASALYVSTYRGLPAVTHGGSWAGYRAQLMRFPEQRFSVACLCNNGGTANPSRLAQGVAEVYLGALMKPAVASVEPPQTAAPAPPGSAALTGAYRNPISGELVTLAIEDGVLVLEEGGSRHPLTRTAPGRFQRIDPPRGSRIEIAFRAGAAGARLPMRVTTTDAGGEVETDDFVPVERWIPTAAELAGLAGTYASSELNTSWRLTVEDGRLFIRHRGLPEEPLTPTIRDAFTVDGLSLTIRRARGEKAAGFTLDAGRVRGVVFARVAG